MIFPGIEVKDKQEERNKEYVLEDLVSVELAGTRLILFISPQKHMGLADPGAASLIPTQSHTFLEVDHEIISTIILLPSTEAFKKGCCQLQAKVCARSTG